MLYKYKNKLQCLYLQNDGSSDYSPNKLPHQFSKSISPPLNQRHRILIQQRSVPSGLTCKTPTKFQVPRCPEENSAIKQLGTIKPLLLRSAGISSKSSDQVVLPTSSGKYEAVTRDSSIGK